MNEVVRDEKKMIQTKTQIYENNNPYFYVPYIEVYNLLICLLRPYSHNLLNKKEEG